MANNVLIDTLSEPLNGATTAKVDIDCGTGNLTIDRLTGGAPVLASGTLEYLENQGVPTRMLDSRNGQAVLTLRNQGHGRPGFRLPWETCNGETEWQVHLNPTVATDLTAHSDGGNVKLDLVGLAVTRIWAETGGGNMDVVLPDNTAGLSVAARTGGGNVTVAVGQGITGSSTVSAQTGGGNVIVDVPGGLAARIHAGSGLGKVSVDPRFSKVDRETYQSPGPGNLLLL